VQRRRARRRDRCQNQYRQFCSQGRKSSAVTTYRASRNTPPIIWPFHEQWAAIERGQLPRGALRRP
jgi:hypothetical protein